MAAVTVTGSHVLLYGCMRILTSPKQLFQTLLQKSYNPDLYYYMVAVTGHTYMIVGSVFVSSSAFPFSRFLWKAACGVRGFLS